MDSLKGKVAVVTGGGSGVGQALAGALANEGMRIVVGDADIKAAEAAVADITQLGARAIASSSSAIALSFQALTWKMLASRRRARTLPESTLRMSA